MGLSLKKLGKQLGKGLKKVAKIAAPIAVGAVTGGSGLAAYAGKALGAKAASKLKSLGVGPKEQAFKAPEVQPVSVKAMMDRATVQSGNFGAAPARRATRKLATMPAKPRTAPRKASTPSKSKLVALYRQWVAAGRPGEWQDYAAANL